MNSILIDFDKIIYPNSQKLNILMQKIKPVPKTSFTIGLIIFSKNDITNILSKLNKGEERIEYLNSASFISNILGYNYLIYNKEKKICEIILDKKDVLSSILSNTMQYFPNDVYISCVIPLESAKRGSILLEEMINNAFSGPYICKNTPLGFMFKEYGLCMFRKNDVLHLNEITAKEQLYIEIDYIVEEFKKGINSCTLHAKLSQSSIEYLSSISHMGSSWNGDKNITQKEVAGRLVVSKVFKNRGKTVYELDVDRENITTGEEEGVELVSSLYNFHSHPREAYNRHSVKLGWPSAQDYIATLLASLKYSTILHIVASIEGFYVISIREYWLNKYNEILRRQTLLKNLLEFIGETYDIKYEPNSTLIDYMEKVNSISYEGFPVFQTEFVRWTDAESVFTVHFLKKGGNNCIARESTFKKYEKYQR